MPQHRSATVPAARKRAALCAAACSDDACSRPSLVNSISSARRNLALALIRSACSVSAAATRPGG